MSKKKVNIKKMAAYVDIIDKTLRLIDDAGGAMMCIVEIERELILKKTDSISFFTSATMGYAENLVRNIERNKNWQEAENAFYETKH